MTTPPSVEQVRPHLADLNRRTAHEAAREELRHAILSGDLAPGTPLILANLADQLGISKTPVREAIRDLATEGLIDFGAYRSAVVHVPTLADAREIYELRGVLEGMAIRAAAPSLTLADLDAAHALCDRMDDERDMAQWTELNRQFHAILTRPAPSARLRGLVDSLRDAAAAQVARSIRHGGVDVAVANSEHRRILGALRAGDVEAAIDWQTRHLNSTLSAIEAFERA
jgi:DNA-binding GntR family transcriptional regulator